MGILKLIYSIILTIMPVTELRAGLPLALNFAKESGVSEIPVFILIVSINILMIFLIFFFLDNIHIKLMELKPYRNLFKRYIKRMQFKVDKFEKKYSEKGFIALAVFVAIPLPGTGAWSGCLISWLLGLERKKSILAISAGVLAAGIIIFAVAEGFSFALAGL